MWQLGSFCSLPHGYDFRGKGTSKAGAEISVAARSNYPTKRR